MASNHPWSLQTYFHNEVGKLTRCCLWTQDARILGCHTLEEPNPTSKNLFLPDTAEKINTLFSGFCVGRVALTGASSSSVRPPANLQPPLTQYEVRFDPEQSELTSLTLNSGQLETLQSCAIRKQRRCEILAV